MDKYKEIIQNNKIVLLSLALAFVYVAMLFKTAGALFFIGFIVIATPVYLITSTLHLNKPERLALTIPLTIGVFMSFVYYLGFLLSSIYSAVIATVILLTILSVVFQKLKKKGIIKNDAVVLLILILLIALLWLIAQYTVINNIPEPTYLAPWFECIAQENNTIPYCNLFY